MTTETRLTWELLVDLEPKLGDLLSAIESVPDIGQTFCANAVWYGYNDKPVGGFKAMVCRLVGWDRVRPPTELMSIEAYDLAYQTCYDALPDCRHAGWLC